LAGSRGLEGALAASVHVLDIDLAIGLRVTQITAPWLREISMLISSRNSLDLDVHGLTSVRQLGVIMLNMHGQYIHKKDDSFCLPRDCPGADNVEVSLNFLHDGGCIAKHVVDATLQGVETFPDVRSMHVKADFSSEDLDPCGEYGAIAYEVPLPEIIVHRPHRYKVGNVLVVYSSIYLYS
jgi:hypothetical protein